MSDSDSSGFGDCDNSTSTCDIRYSEQEKAVFIELYDASKIAEKSNEKWEDRVSREYGEYEGEESEPRETLVEYGETALRRRLKMWGVIKTDDEGRALTLTLHSEFKGLLPDAIGNLVCLTELDLYGNQLTSLPDAIGNLVCLTELYLSNNQLTSLPDAIGNLVCLTKLYLSKNQLTSLSDAIGNLVCLTSLDNCDNQLTSLPDAIGSLVCLAYLGLSNNQLTSLPDAIGNLVCLTKLDLSNNELTSLPNAIGNLVCLKKLYLFDNQLTSLPDAIGNLVCLTKLLLDKNQLTSLPDAIGNLVCLERLELDCNPITSGLENVRHLIKLSTLSLDSLDLCTALDLPAALRNESLQDQLSFLRQKYGSSSSSSSSSPTPTTNSSFVELKRVRLLFVGNGASGKTTLLHRLKHASFLSTSAMTDGIVMERLVLSDVTFTTLDFAGQKEYAHTHSLFFNDGAIFLAVHQPRTNAEQQLEVFLEMVSHFAPMSPIILATSKADETTMSEEEIEDLRAKHPRIVGVVPVDSASGTGIDELKDLLVEVALSMEGAVISVPPSYQRLELELAKFSENAIFSMSPTELSSLAVKECGMEESNVDLALSLFCSWGIIHRLSNGDFVLRPQDLADVVACIFTKVASKKDRIGECKEGLLRHNNETLGLIWGNYCPSLWRFSFDEDNSSYKPPFLQLLQDSGLAYELFDPSGRPLGASLVPALLPDKPASVTLSADAVDEVKLSQLMFPPASSATRHGSVILSFKQLPATFMPRLLVKLRGLATLGGSWKHGASLQLGDSYAIVFERDNSIVCCSAGKSVTARAAVFNAIMDLHNSTYASLLRTRVDVVFGGREWSQDDIEERMEDPGYLKTKSGEKVQLRGLAVLFRKESVKPTTSGGAKEEDEEPGASVAPVSTLSPNLHTLLEMVTVIERNENEAEDDLVSLDIQLGKCIAEFLSLEKLRFSTKARSKLCTLWVGLSVSSRGAKKERICVPLTPGMTLNDPWKFILDAKIELDVAGRHSTDESSKELLDRRREAESLLVRVLKTLGVVFLDDWTVFLTDLSQKENAVKFGQGSFFENITPERMIYKEFLASARAMQIAKTLNLDRADSQAHARFVKSKLDELSTKLDSAAAAVMSHIDRSAARVLVAIDHLSEEVKEGFSTIGDSLVSTASKAALGNKESMDGLASLLTALKEQQNSQGMVQLDAINRSLAKLGPDLAAQFENVVAPGSSCSDLDFGIKIESLIAMVGDMQKEVKAISKGVVDLKALASRIDARGNVMPRTFIVKPAPELAEEGSNSSVFAKVGAFFKKASRKISKLCWDQSVLVFVCPITGEEVSCGPKGVGYEIKIPTEFLKKALPAMQFGLMLFKVALSTQGLGAAIPCVATLLPDMQSEYLNAYAASVLESAGVQDVGSLSADMIDTHLKGLAETDDSEASTFFANLVRERELGVEGAKKAGADWSPKLTGLKKVVSSCDSACMWVSEKGRDSFDKLGMAALMKYDEEKGWDESDDVYF